MWLDRSLKWGKHINETRQKLLKLINVFKVLAGSDWGIHPKHLRHLYISIIRSRLDYGSFLYDSSINSHLQKLETVQNQVMRVIGGFIKTTPIQVMQSELCLPPLYIRRMYLAGKFWMRAKSRSNNVTIQVLECLNRYCDQGYWRNKKLPMLIFTHRKLVEYPIHCSDKLLIYSLDRWITYFDLSSIIRTTIDGITKAKKSMDTIILQKHCHTLMYQTYDQYYHVFTDGSKEEFADSGAAFFDPQLNIQMRFKINSKISIMHSELIAISEALSYIVSVDRKKNVIFSDSKSALQHLSRITLNIQGLPIAYSILETIRKIYDSGKEVVMQWVPSHVGIVGNEEADRAARQATSDGVLYNCLPFYSEALFKIKETCRQVWKEHFNERSLSTGIWYKTIQSDLPRYPWFDKTKMNRQNIVDLLRLRSGHIPRNKFKYLMRLTSSMNCSVCDKVEDVYHILTECVRSVVQRRRFLIYIDSNVGTCNSFLASPLSGEAKNLLKVYQLSLEEE